jgi:hypothetical protein
MIRMTLSPSTFWSIAQSGPFLFSSESLPFIL